MDKLINKYHWAINYIHMEEIKLNAIISKIICEEIIGMYVTKD